MFWKKWLRRWMSPKKTVHVRRVVRSVLERLEDRTTPAYLEPVGTLDVTVRARSLAPEGTSVTGQTTFDLLGQQNANASATYVHESGGIVDPNTSGGYINVSATMVNQQGAGPGRWDFNPTSLPGFLLEPVDVGFEVNTATPIEFRVVADTGETTGQPVDVTLAASGFGDNFYNSGEGAPAAIGNFISTYRVTIHHQGVSTPLIDETLTLDPSTSEQRVSLEDKQLTFRAAVGQTFTLNFALSGSGTHNAGAVGAIFSFTHLATSVPRAMPSPGGPYTIYADNPLTLDASSSTGHDSDAVFTWDINGDGQFDDATGINPTLTPETLAALGIAAAGQSHNVYVRVFDDGLLTTSEATTLTVEPGATLDVTTTATQNIGLNVFGPYLPGVGLDVPIIVTATDPGDQVSHIKWSLGGQTAISLPPSGSDTWTFTVNPGTLAADSHTLTVTGYNAAGRLIKSATKSIILRVEKRPLTLAVMATYPGGGLLGLTALRFIKGTPLNLGIGGTIFGVPAYYDKVRVALGGPAAAVAVSSGAGSLGFSLAKDVNSLAIGSNSISIFIGTAPLASVSSLAITPPSIRLVASPAWLPATKLKFSATLGAYVYEKVQSKFSVALPKPRVNTGLAWLDTNLNALLTQYSTGASLTLGYSLTIPVALATAPKFTVHDLVATATVLGKLVWNQRFTTGHLIVGGTLNPQTLTPTTLAARLKQSVTVGSKTFFDRKLTIRYDKAEPLLGVTASLGVKLSGMLKANAGLVIGWNGRELTLISTGTFVTLTAIPQATVTAKAIATFARGYLGTATAQAFATVKLTVQGTVKIGGTLAKPAISSRSLTGILSGNYGYKIGAHNAVTNKDVLKEDNDKFGPIKLF